MMRNCFFSTGFLKPVCLHQDTHNRTDKLLEEVKLFVGWVRFHRLKTHFGYTGDSR